MPRFVPVLNRAYLVGNLTRDPEGLRRTPTGMAVTYLRLALNTGVRTGGGEMREEKCFVDVSAWGRQAETAVEELEKGSQILVAGRLWSDEVIKEDRKQSRLSVVAERIVLLAGPRRRVHDGAVTGRQKDQSVVGGKRVEETAEGDSEDLQY